MVSTFCLYILHFKLYSEINPSMRNFSLTFFSLLEIKTHDSYLNPVDTNISSISYGGLTMKMTRGENQKSRGLLLKGIGTVAVCALVSSVVFAGDKLFLRTGTINPKTLPVSQSIDLQDFNALREYVVQFKQKPTESDKAALISRGISIFKYLPDDAYIVRSTRAQSIAARKLAQVNAVIDYSPFMKVSADFSSFSIFTAQKVENVLIKTFINSDTESVLEGMEKISSQILVLKSTGNSILANIPQEYIYRVASLNGIEHIQPYIPMKVWNDFDLLEGGNEVVPTVPGDYTDLDGFEDGTKVMNFESAWNAGLTGEGQIGAMADTGVDTGDLNTIHKDLNGAIKKGFIYGMFSKSWNDPMGHGTHVAGSIVSRGTNSGGKIKGGAYGATLVAQGMWSPTMENLTVPPQLETMFTVSYNEGARVHSNSWGAPRNFGAYDNFAVQVDEFVWNHLDMLPVFAAGNSGVDKNKDGRIDANSMSSPGTSKNCLTVGASENINNHGGIQAPISKLRTAAENWPAEPISSDFISNNIDGMAMFSSRGPTLDGRTKPDVVAPGTNILSLMSQVEGASPMWGAYNKLYTYAGGTSMATPLTAGAALLVRQKLQKDGYASPSAALVKAVLMHTATDIFPGQYGLVGESKGQEILTERPNSVEGYGRVNVSQIVGLPMKVVDENEGVAQGQDLTYAADYETAPTKIWVTMVYSDAPAVANAAKTLVNDLDLVVVSPDGKELKLNDTVNNHEMIEVKNPQAGSYKVIVRGQRVPQGKSGKQPFALLISAQ